MQCTAQRIQPVFYNNLAWNGKYNLQKHEDPRCPVVMTHASTAGGTDSIPGWESHMPQGATQKEEKKKKTPSNYYVIHLTLGEGNGTPLQYSCLENPMYGGAL